MRACLPLLLTCSVFHLQPSNQNVILTTCVKVQRFFLKPSTAAPSGCWGIRYTRSQRVVGVWCANAQLVAQGGCRHFEQGDGLPVLTKQAPGLPVFFSPFTEHGRTVTVKWPAPEHNPGAEELLRPHVKKMMCTCRNTRPTFTLLCFRGEVREGYIDAGLLRTLLMRCSGLEVQHGLDACGCTLNISRHAYLSGRNKVSTALRAKGGTLVTAMLRLQPRDWAGKLLVCEKELRPFFLGRTLEPHYISHTHTMREIVHIQAGQCGNQIGTKAS
ncbi:hypothetical protein JZ751_000897 [Albula glossodonta]|uniref:Uncharacterized protein n=1 Tax=Albula glossodonta TaxID=121402 RepID=A0A8T2PXL0_9TELE|nr:hypothetical protein JZ751_000897 [Albula glossodonta]